MAMASALPIFFSGGGEGHEIVKKFNIGYVSNAGDLIGLENNIKKFSKLSNEDIKEFKKNIINIVKNNFDYKKQQLSLFNFIKEQIQYSK